MAKKVIEVVSDGSEKPLAELVERFSVKRAVAWLRVKFPSFDTSRAEGLACDATKNEKEYFDAAELLGYVTRLPSGGTHFSASADAANLGYVTRLPSGGTHFSASADAANLGYVTRLPSGGTHFSASADAANLGYVTRLPSGGTHFSASADAANLGYVTRLPSGGTHFSASADAANLGYVTRLPSGGTHFSASADAANLGYVTRLPSGGTHFSASADAANLGYVTRLPSGGTHFSASADAANLGYVTRLPSGGTHFSASADAANLGYVTRLPSGGTHFSASADAANLGYVTRLPSGGTHFSASADAANRPLLVAAIRMRKDLTERTSRLVQFNYAKKLLQNAVARGAQGVNGLPSQGLFFFYDKDGIFRLSLVTGEVEKRRFRFSAAKRQSFYVEPSAANNIVKRRLCPPIKTFDELRDAFSVEQLTREFYARLFDWYAWALSPEVNTHFPNDLDDDRDDRKYNNEAVIRLITRLMFTWFIRQRRLVPDALFDREGLKGVLKNFDPDSMEQDNYYRAILQNLFFATFNCPQTGKGRLMRRWIDADVNNAGNGVGLSSDYRVTTVYRYRNEFRKPDEFLELMKRVPFLNCALFDCLDKVERPEDGGRKLYFDGFSTKRKRQAHVPNGLFFDGERGLINLFGLYEFTVNENDADDSDVALDPELLGKVFENLLGAFNPETQETARNATGSFYTPREIVDYMVEESLKAYLRARLGETGGARLEPRGAGDASREGASRLATHVSCADLAAKLDDLFDRGKAAEGAETPFSPKEREAILDALYGCRILDPACGSGAFPMGVLHCMVRLLTRLDPQCISIRERLLSRYREDKAAVDPAETADERRERLEELESRLKEGQHHPDYERKLYLIENCIYGVDIQPIATQISKLRFFISLLCDQLRSSFDPEAENFGLLSLPNLEAKFVCANTLVSLPDIEDELKLGDVKELRGDLQANRHKIFRARSTRTKEKYKRKELEIRDAIRQAVYAARAKPDEVVIAQCREQIADAKRRREAVAKPDWYEEEVAVQTDLFAAVEYKRVRKDRNKSKRDQIDAEIAGAEKKIKDELAKGEKSNVSAAEEYAKMVAGWDPYDQNASSAFFDPEWMFNVRDGFDVIIGNPPYVQLQANGGELAKAYQGCGYETFAKTGDLYCLFYERGAKLLSERGILCYITSNKWMRAAYGEVLRKWLAEKTNPLLLIDFAGEKIFESASVDTNILVLGHGANKGETLSVTATEECRDGLARFVVKRAFANCYRLGEPWQILSETEKKLAESLKKGKPLGALDIQINYGIKTGFNEAFIIDEETRGAILRACADDDERRRTNSLLKPVLRGRDVTRYGKVWAGLWQVATFPALHLDIDDYPAVRDYLLTFGKARLEQSGKTSIVNGITVKARKKTSNQWFETQDTITYMNDFAKPKLIWAETMRIWKGSDARFPRFSYDEDGMFTDKTCFIATGEDLKYILANLNSTVGRYQCGKEVVILDNGGYLMQKIYLEKVRIAPATPDQQKPIIALVDQILAAKRSDPKADTSAQETQIDRLVYGLYGLTEEEIAVVEGRGAGGRTPPTESGRAHDARSETRNAGGEARHGTSDEEEELE